MDIIAGSVLIAFGFLSFIPVIILNQYKQVLKYRALRHLMQVIFIWTLLIFAFYVIDGIILNYYLLLLIYPTVFLIVYYAFETVQTFTQNKTPMWLNGVFVTYFVVIALVSLTNPLHQALINIEISAISSIDDLIYSELGWFFFVHTAFCYSIIITFLVRLLKYLRQPAQKEVDEVSFYLIIITVTVGLTLNFTHLFIYNFYIDPTYLALVLFGFALYFAVYKRDFHLNLLNRGRKEVIDSMREMMIIADHNGMILEYSVNVQRFFKNDETPTTVDEFLRVIQAQAIVYEHFDEVKDGVYIENKPYLYTRKQVLELSLFKKKGQLILMYDETQLVELVHNLNYLRSYDQMTELYNRNYFEERRDEYEKNYPYLGVIMLDLNGLKLLNDYYGHEKGDAWIIRLAKVLKEFSHQEDGLAIRLGGDEFLLMFKSTESIDLHKVANTIDENVYDQSIENHVSISYGVAYRKDRESMDKILSRADKELYKMKSNRSPMYRQKILDLIEKKKA